MGARWDRLRARALSRYLLLRYPRLNPQADDMRSGLAGIMAGMATINLPGLGRTLASLPGESARQLGAWLGSIEWAHPIFLALGVFIAARGLWRLRQAAGETQERKDRREAARARAQELSILAHRAEIDIATARAKPSATPRRHRL